MTGLPFDKFDVLLIRPLSDFKLSYAAGPGPKVLMGSFEIMGFRLSTPNLQKTDYHSNKEVLREKIHLRVCATIYLLIRVYMAGNI